MAQTVERGPTSRMLKLLVAATCALASAVAAEKPVEGNAGPSFEVIEHPLAKVPRESFVVISPAGNRVAAVLPESGGRHSTKSLITDLYPRPALSPPCPCRVILDGQTSEPFDVLTLPVFSADGSRVAYAGRRKGRHRLVVDGVETTPAHGISALAFSADSGRLAYAAFTEQSAFVVAEGGEPGPRHYDFIYSIGFSPNAEVWYVAERGGRFLVVVGNKEFAPFDDVGRPVFSPDGKRMAHWAGRQKAKKDWEYFIVVDEQPQTPYDRVDMPRFSADGSRIGYWAGRGKVDFAVVDGVEVAGSHSNPLLWIKGPGERGWAPQDLAFGADNGLAYMVRQKKNLIVVAGDSRTARTKSIGFRPTHSRNGNRFAYGLVRDHQVFVVVDEVEFPTYIECYGEQMFSTAFQAYSALAPVFSPDGEHFAFRRSGDPEWCKASDRQCDVDALEISAGLPIGSRVRCGKRSGSCGMHIVVDGTLGPRYDYIHRVEWVGNTTLRLIAERDETFLKVLVSLESRTAP